MRRRECFAAWDSQSAHSRSQNGCGRAEDTESHPVSGRFPGIHGVCGQWAVECVTDGCFYRRQKKCPQFDANVDGHSFPHQPFDHLNQINLA